MEKNIEIKEDSIEVASEVNATIVEFEEKYDEEYFKSRYKNKERLILVAYVDEQPAGYMVAYDRDGNNSFYCWMTGVDPRFRRLGLLKKMVEYLSDWAKAKGYEKITIKTRNNRREMLSFLVKNGFNFVNVETKQNIKDNRIFLEKVIG